MVQKIHELEQGTFINRKKQFSKNFSNDGWKTMDEIL